MFLDTSGLFCLYDSHDASHDTAVREYRRAERSWTHSYVLAELVALVHSRRLPRQDAIDYMRDLLDDPMIEVLWVDELHHRAALDLLSHRIDKGYSLCDAVSFLQMREARVDEALTTDRHFEQEGFVRLLKH
jgi:uncharacterized protein